MQQTRDRLKLRMPSDVIWWLVVALGIVLRLRQYLLNRSLWEDEASLAVNLVNRNFGELTQLLDYHQAAPIGFLFIEKLSITLLGNHDYILRLFPLFAGILATYLIYRIARASFGTVGLFAVFVFAISWWLVHYSSELKQYGSDVMVALLLVFLAGKCLEENGQAKDFLWLGIAGTLTIWVSHPSIFILAGIGLVLALAKLTRKDFAPWAWILGLGIGWSASFGIEYLVSLRNIVADEYLIDYWRKAYIPLPPWSDKGWFVSTYYSFLFLAFHRADNVMALVTLALSSIGALTLLIRDWKMALLMFSPFVMVTIASALQRYPLKDRFMLFLIPFVLLLMAEGFRGIYWLVARWKPNIAGVFSGILALAVVWQIAPVTYEKAISGARENIRPVFAYVAENRTQADIVYIFHRTDPVYHYYAPFYGLDTGNIMVGVYDPRKRVALQNFEDDVDSLIGNSSVWFIFSEIIDCVDCEGEDTQAFYLEHLNKFGIILDSFDGSGANAYLYDLSP
ncbi:MAG: glycosyltransferase family 39 protein [Anaerolineales bacterium]|nr:glycosyltransferase family 39 protein [Anaerolineales bacterium]